MRLYGILFLTIGLTLGLSGCTKTPSESGAGNVAGTSAETQTKEEVKAAVGKFLKAVRGGQDDEIFAMMSPTARKVCGKDKLPALPASDTADFTIDDTKLIGADGAHVITTMIDTDPQGGKIKDTFVWVMRKTEEGWKVAGAAFTIYEGMEPITLNFESEDAIAKAKLEAEKQGQEAFAKARQLEAARQTQAKQPNAQVQQPGTQAQQPKAQTPAQSQVQVQPQTQTQQPRQAQPQPKLGSAVSPTNQRQ